MKRKDSPGENRAKQWEKRRTDDGTPYMRRLNAGGEKGRGAANKL